MTRLELLDLLALITSVDGRNFTDHSGDAWYELLQSIPLDLALRAAHEHYTRSTDRLLPAHIIRGATALRGDNQPPHLELDTDRSELMPNAKAREYAQAIRDDLAERRALRQPPEPAAAEPAGST